MARRTNNTPSSAVALCATPTFSYTRKDINNDKVYFNKYELSFVTYHYFK